MPAGGRDYEVDWQPARLLSTIGLRGEEERERRATSALLAVMMAVPEFGQELVKELGGPRGTITTFTEIQMKDANGKRHIPDGAIVCKRGKNKWCALVEVKTGSAQLKTDQVSRYLDIARENRLDAVVTISNQITAERTDTVVEVDKRKLRSVKLLNISWWRILTEAIMQYRHKGVSDPDQAWILGELITYLDDPKSGASGFQGMGEQWVNVRDAATHGTLRATDPGASEIAARWDQFVEYLALSLSQDLGREVKPERSRTSTHDSRRIATVKELVASGTLSDSIKVPDAVSSLHVIADLRTKRVTTSVRVDAPKTGRPLTRINWILKQLVNAPEDLRIDVRFANTQETSSLLLSEAREEPSELLSASDAKREPRSFELALTRKMGLKRGADGGSFSRETRRQTVVFYRDLVQNLKAWQAPAPKLLDGSGDDESMTVAAAINYAPSESDVVQEVTVHQESSAESTAKPPTEFIAATIE